MSARSAARPCVEMVVAILLVASLVSDAEAGEPAEPVGTADKEAAQLFEHALKLIDGQVYDRAIVELERAYALHPDPTVLYNIGFAYAASGDPARAADALERYLAAIPDEPSVLRTRAQAKLAAQLQLVGVVSIDADSPAGLTMDGSAVDAVPWRRRAQIGPHVVVLERPPSPTERWHIDLHAGETVRVIVTAPRQAQALAASSPSRQAEPSLLTARVSEQSSERWRLRTKVAVGLTALLGISSAGLFAWNYGRYQEWSWSRDRLSGSPLSPTDARALNQRLSEIQSLDRVGIMLGVGTLVSGTITAFLFSRNAPPRNAPLPPEAP